MISAVVATVVGVALDVTIGLAFAAHHVSPVAWCGFAILSALILGATAVASAMAWESWP